MLKTGTDPKKSENLAELSVADVTMRRKSRRRATTFLRMPNSTSVCRLRSCASSMMMQLYVSRSDSRSVSRNSTPSVMYLITVSGPVQSSKRMAYPTSSPSRHPNSSATRFATDMAATRRGCVHPMRPLDVYPLSARYCVICVVLPDPVSPITTNTWLSLTAWMSSSRSLKMGSDSRCACMGSADFCPNVGALPNASTFHSGISYPPRPTPRSSCARCRSPASGMGSSHGRLRSLGMESSMVRCCCSFSSRRSLASADCVIAARCRLPSGFLTILMGDTSPPGAVCPARNGASSSLISTSTSCSASSSYASSPSFSASYMGYSSTGRTPDAMSCLASHRSGELRRFTGRRRVSVFLSSSESLMPDRPRRDDPGAGGGRFAALGLLRSPSAPAPPPAPPSGASAPTRSSPVSWLTSRMLSAMRVEERVVTLTHTGWSRAT
mmetsp:Transcript_85/g.190  ORF Transcript_85/g.190 Transcript_85/m.190 type:complete len:439 (+) Transcript_85:1603-2919(+)